MEKEAGLINGEVTSKAMAGANGRPATRSEITSGRVAQAQRGLATPSRVAAGIARIPKRVKALRILTCHFSIGKIVHQSIPCREVKTLRGQVSVCSMSTGQLSDPKTALTSRKMSIFKETKKQRLSH
jgi:hypothetical protein